MKAEGKLFIGGLHWQTDEDSLVNYFSQFGEVMDRVIMRDGPNGRSRGFAFLTFKDPSSVDKVLETTHVLDGKTIDPKRAIPKDQQENAGKIFVGGLPSEITEQEFHDFFAKYGNVIDANLMVYKETGRSRGFGFVTYDSLKPIDDLFAAGPLVLGNRTIEIRRAQSRN
ncbi:hypothetical protein CANCADRAFT_26233, partial [Tortispora caseinolytica NRRL Y-17796]